MTVTLAICLGVVCIWSGVSVKDKMFAFIGVIFLLCAGFMSIDQQMELRYKKDMVYQLKDTPPVIIEPLQATTELTKPCYQLKGCK